jgi:hypothetical protein
MRGIDDPRAWLTPLLGIFFCACGVSRGDWEQKVRENEEVTRQLTTEQSARQKAEADYADTLDEVDAMKAQLSERGLSIEAMAASLEAQNKALVEYQARTAQLLEMQARFDALRAKLKKLSEIGLSVVVRNNRMVVELPGDLLFDSGSDRLSDEGKAKWPKQFAPMSTWPRVSSRSPATRTDLPFPAAFFETIGACPPCAHARSSRF